jgi:uncharacterized peroxidase-related enzyme
VAALLAAVRADWREADLSPEDRALCAFAERLTHHPAEMGEVDVASLRTAGFDDLQIHDAIQVVSYFNYINRVADAVGVDLEEEMPADPRR